MQKANSGSAILRSTSDRWEALERPSSDPLHMECYAIKCRWCGQTVMTRDQILGFAKIVNPTAALISSTAFGLLHALRCFEPERKHKKATR